MNNDYRYQRFDYDVVDEVYKSYVQSRMLSGCMIRFMREVYKRYVLDVLFSNDG